LAKLAKEEEGGQSVGCCWPIQAAKLASRRIGTALARDVPGGNFHRRPNSSRGADEANQHWEKQQKTHTKKQAILCRIGIGIAAGWTINECRRRCRRRHSIKRCVEGRRRGWQNPVAVPGSGWHLSTHISL
jgi:hypothetical protein